ncbi:sensor histidine kinase [Cerasicoccus fimbriatus]|uniref:sensor histidine kinase n=1 Tax=Cerasicoccus fimbriatus TaxID=3014554 RepID=UPI0022B44444|nr:HAMP domain-containing sensor histidine kinase [Cerasicoccus sp. TK19100]
MCIAEPSLNWSAKSSPSVLALIMAGSYILLSGFYIVVSTLAVSDAFDASEGALLVELTKGLLFILVTGVGIFLGSRYLMGMIARQCVEIEKQRRSIEALDKRASVGLLASAIGHDANNLLTAARMSVDLMKRGLDPDRLSALMNTVEEALNELMELNRRLVRGGHADQPGELKVRCLKNESERVIQFIDNDHPISRLKIEFISKGDVSVPINRHLYFQVLLNLLLNVSRHAGEYSTVRISTLDCDQAVCVLVEDNGPGVPAPKREMIFTPYYSEHPEGSGLGLASVRAVMRMHGGDICCEESCLGGAKFVLNFPREASKPEQAAV